MIICSVGYLEIGISNLNLVLDLEGVGLDLDLDLGASVLGIFARDQHCYYVKYQTKKLLKSFTNRRKHNFEERMHPGPPGRS